MIALLTTSLILEELIYSIRIYLCNHVVQLQLAMLKKVVAMIHPRQARIVVTAPAVSLYRKVKYRTK